LVGETEDGMGLGSGAVWGIDQTLYGEVEIDAQYVSQEAATEDVSGTVEESASWWRYFYCAHAARYQRDPFDHVA
jgi:hypothetical protein